MFQGKCTGKYQVHVNTYNNRRTYIVVRRSYPFPKHNLQTKKQYSIDCKQLANLKNNHKNINCQWTQRRYRYMHTVSLYLAKIFCRWWFTNRRRTEIKAARKRQTQFKPTKLLSIKNFLVDKELSVFKSLAPLQALNICYSDIIKIVIKTNLENS